MSDWEKTEVNGVEITTDDPEVKDQLKESGAELVPYSEDKDINPAVVAGGIAGIAAAGYGIYRLGKWIAGKISAKAEEKSVQKLQKKGYIVIPQRSEADLQVVGEENFDEDDPVDEEEVPEPEEPPKKPKKK